MLLAAAQHAYDPAEQDDGYGHAYETCSHPLEVCKAHKGSVSVISRGAEQVSLQLFIRLSDYRRGFWELTQRVPLILPYCLRQIDWQISWQR